MSPIQQVDAGDVVLCDHDALMPFRLQEGTDYTLTDEGMLIKANALPSARK